VAWFILGCLGMVCWGARTDLCSSSCLRIGPQPLGLLSSKDDRGVFLALKQWLQFLLSGVVVARLIA